MLQLLIALSLYGCAEEEPNKTEEEESTETEDTAVEEILPETTKRKVLHEVFTGSTCGPCFGAEEIIFGVLEGDEDSYTHISYQVGSDPYISFEGYKRRMYYIPEADSYSIPYIYVDGINGFHPVEVNDDAGYLQDDFDRYAAEPSTIQLNVDHQIEGKSVDIQVSILPLQDNPAENLKLQIAIIEKTTELNVGTNGQTEFHHVMKKMIPDDLGTVLTPLTRGEQIDLSFSYTFQGEYDENTGISDMVDHETAHTVEEFEDLAVVIFIQDDENYAVLQSEWSE